MDELVFPLTPVAAQSVYHAYRYSGVDPDIAVDNPYQVALGLSICATHIPDLWVRPQCAAVDLQSWILILEQDLDIKVRVVCYYLAQDGNGGVIVRRNAKTDRELFSRVCLLERGCEALVQLRLEAFDRAYYGDVRRIFMVLGGGGGTECRRGGVVSASMERQFMLTNRKARGGATYNWV